MFDTKRKPISRPLSHFLSCGVKLIPTFPDGRTRGSWKNASAFTTSIERIAQYWQEGFRCFQLHPADNGFLCLDIDRKNGKDGVHALYMLFTESGLVLPVYLRDIGSYPALTSTPSGGYHLYFRYQGNSIVSRDIAGGLECVHFNHLITVPGSQKESGVYRFYGDLNAAPELPPVIMRFLTERKVPQTKHPVWSYKHAAGDLSLEEIAHIIDEQGVYSPGTSRNRYAYEVARFAKKKHHSADAVGMYIRERLEAPDFDAGEISRTIQSAYRK